MTERRAQPMVVVTGPAPVIVNGRPMTPRFLGQLPSTGTVRLGPKHLHVQPKPDPSDGGYGRRTWTARWSVRSLPDPKAYGGSYWLGDPSPADGTAGIQSGARQWAADNDSGPAWHSFFPFKPSVVSVDHYLPGGDVVHHPRGVNLNSHYIEHMWMDWGGPHRQPFTWLVAACVTAWQPGEPWHHLLNSGARPPRLSVGQVGTPRDLNEVPDYRTQLAVSRDHVVLRTSPSGSGGIVRARTNPARHPRLFIGIFDGKDSRVGAYGPRAKRIHRGTVTTGHAFTHRHYVLGRAHRRLDQRAAGSLLIFELRFFNRALSPDELDEQYNQIAATYNFHAYIGS